MKAFMRPLSLLLLLLVLFGQAILPSDAFARKSRQSFSSRNRSSSGAQSTPKGSGFNSSQSTDVRDTSFSSRSKTHSQKGSVFNPNSQKTSRGTSLADAARRAESQSRFRASGAQDGITYRDVVTGDPALRNSLTAGNAADRNLRRTALYNSMPPENERYYQYRPNAVYRDPYDNFFFRYVTPLWLFHHWDAIDPARFDEPRRRELEAEIADMEARGLERDPDYTLEGTEPDLQYSDDELANLQDTKELLEFEATPEGTDGGVAWLSIFLVGLVGFGGFYFVAVRRSEKN